ncbi:Protein TAB2-like, chloroplastic [Porphyridium purpureum]|uniref:Protein TAB2-like, chloroplastic n=1 Tax=Porphyridium purpureum TaxID=35688 RepID=A0A5J4YPG2_PORPP|nr:Protein TAB2-like, chloroplastic [Porphyridium purpureum]|eukprot:POR8562..scf222_8
MEAIGFVVGVSSRDAGTASRCAALCTQRAVMRSVEGSAEQQVFANGRMRHGVGRWRNCNNGRVTSRTQRKKSRSDQVAGSPAGSSSPLVELPKPSETWELDFYSRPVLGEDGKKIWELLITDKDGVLEHVEQVPSSSVNSTELRKRVAAVIERAQTKPKVIRFFRGAMRNMISIALSEFDVVVKPSRRTYSLFALQRHRDKNVYPAMPGYRESLRPDMQLNVSISEKLPDALRGERYAFVQLPYALLKEFSKLELDFGELCPVDSELKDDELIPGLVIYSKRATPIAAWMSGLELSCISADMKKREILVQCDLDTSYLFGRVVPSIVDEAREFERRKNDLNGLHFVAVQKDEESDEVDGFWLLQEMLL